jgi:hypothetical protein
VRLLAAAACLLGCGSRTGLLPGDVTPTSDGGTGGVTLVASGGRGGTTGSSGRGGAGASGNAGAAHGGAGSGGAGAGGVAGTGGQSESDCMPFVGADPMLDDFESGQIRSFSPIDHAWYPGRLEVERDQSFGIVPVEPPREGSSSRFAFGTWGVGSYSQIGVQFVRCLSVPRALGIRFFVRVTIDTPRLIVRADTSANFPVKSGGRCDDCQANWTQVPIVKGWQEIAIPFEAFTGGTFPYDTNDQMGFAFQWSNLPNPATQYEFSIDDVSYVF